MKAREIFRGAVEVADGVRNGLHGKLVGRARSRLDDVTTDVQHLDVGGDVVDELPVDAVAKLARLLALCLCWADSLL